MADRTHRTRRRLFVATLTILAMAVAVGAQAHGPRNEVMDRQARQFNAIRGNPPDHSNAPRTFAPCVDGMAADTYPCHRIDLMSHLTLDDLGVTFVNDMWGWTDPATRKDYALVGAAEGVVFVDISDPKRPDVIGTLPTASTEGGDLWRDLKVYEHHVFIVSEHDDHPMQVFDLRQLRGVSGDPVTFSETALYDGTAEQPMDHAHNIAINEDTGYAYIVGAHSCAGGLHMVDISDPANPVFAGCFSEHGYIHDTQCVIYDGPDAAYQGREICFNANANFFGFHPDLIDNYLSIVDVTVKSDPVPLAQVEYATDGYSHQGWLTEDHRYFLHGDELDEFFHGINTRTRVWDVTDLDAPFVSANFDNTTPAIDHNIYTEGRWAYASNYTAGFRIYDLRDIASGSISEVAYFDVFPADDAMGFAGGAWSNYGWFRQSTIVAVSSSDEGLFVLRPRLGGQR